MADNTRGIELRRVEESLRQSTKDAFQRIETIERVLSRMEDMMLQLSRQQSEVMQKLQDGSPSGNTNTNPPTYQAPTRFSKVEFLRFSGDEVKGWICRCE